MQTPLSADNMPAGAWEGQIRRSLPLKAAPMETRQSHWEYGQEQPSY